MNFTGRSNSVCPLAPPTAGTGPGAVPPMCGDNGGDVGISVVSLGVAMGAGWHRCSTSTSEPFWRGLGAVALGGLPRSTSELIGEDSLGNH